MASTALAAETKRGSFAEFDARARAGARLNVVFFGASLTWSANASDPVETSYRAVMRDRFEAHYPAAHFRFRDSAIGGTGSQLGVFRLDRDVLAHKPDLVFVDFTANDGIDSADPETLASYESILRRLAGAGIPVVQVAFPFRWDIETAKLPKMKRLNRGASRSNVLSVVSPGFHRGHEVGERAWPEGSFGWPAQAFVAPFPSSLGVRKFMGRVFRRAAEGRTSAAPLSIPKCWSNAKTGSVIDLL